MLCTRFVVAYIESKMWDFTNLKTEQKRFATLGAK